MGTTQSAEQGGETAEEMASSPSVESMVDAPAVGRTSGGGGGGGGGDGYTVAQQIDVAAPMDISGTPRSSGYEQPRDNSMPDSSFASSFGSFMSPPDGHPGTAARSSPLRYSPFSARAPPR